MTNPGRLGPQRISQALKCATQAAYAAGKLMRTHRHSAKVVQAATQHDIKLELDVRCQKIIQNRLQREFPAVAFLGEEGVYGDPDAPARWVVDPIDGTVNFTYGIPHACVSIALQARAAGPQKPRAKRRVPAAAPAYQTVLGVVYDPFSDELWTARRGGPARLNGRVIQVSRRRRLEESIVAIGFAKQAATLQKMLPTFNRLVHRVRKVRIMGAAALELVYVASGRMDAYVEYGLRLWDIAAGGFILECAGGEFWHEPIPGEHRFRILAHNGHLRRALEKLG